MNAVMADTSTFCEACGGSGQRFSTTLAKMIRCPQCKPRQLPWDHDALRRMARRERQRVKTLVAARLIPVLAEVRVFQRWPAELATTARVLDRWGSFGSGRPADNPDLYRESLAVPLDPDTQAIVTACIGPDPRARVDRYQGNVPIRVRAATYDIWFRGAAPSHVGEKHGMSPRTFGRFLDDCLRMHQRAFLASKHSDLILLIDARS